MTTFGVTPQGFVLKRLNDILSDISTRLNAVQDPTTGEYLVVDLSDENDPLVQVVHAAADQISVCWEQLQECYNQHDPLKATGAALSGLVQLNGITRRPNETDTELRLRQQVSTTLTGKSTIDDLYAALYNSYGVTFCKVYQNSTLAIDANGIPPKSVAAVVVGGSDLLIADALFTHLPIDTTTIGNTELFCQDSQGYSYSIKYTVPTSVPVFVTVNATVVDDRAFPSDGVQQIIAAIVKYAETGAASMGITSGFIRAGFVPGASVYASELYVPANVVLGLRIDSIYVGLSANPSGSVASINWNEDAVILESNVSVVVL